MSDGLPIRREPGPHGERRAQPRVPCSIRFPVSLVRPGGVPDGTLDLIALDISAAGIRLRAPDGVSVGDSALIRMTGRSGSPGLVGLEVVHASGSSGGGLIIGARFVALTAEMVRAMLHDHSPITMRRRASA